MTIFAWLESTTIARSVGESLLITAWLSASHILAFTLVMGAALLSNLRVLDVVLRQRTLVEVIRPTSGAILIGLAISLVTGLLLFSPRATSVINNNTFQTKMLLLLTAAAFHFLVQTRVARSARVGVLAMRLTGTVGLILWVGLALTACWFILFE